MASRKTLKKHVKMIAGDLFADCVALSMCDSVNKEELERIMKEVIALYQDFVHASATQISARPRRTTSISKPSLPNR